MRANSPAYLDQNTWTTFVFDLGPLPGLLDPVLIRVEPSAVKEGMGARWETTRAALNGREGGKFRSISRRSETDGGRGC